MVFHHPYVGWGEELGYEPDIQTLTGQLIRNCIRIIPYLVQIQPIFPFLPFCKLQHSFLDVLVHLFNQTNRVANIQQIDDSLRQQLHEYKHIQKCPLCKTKKVCQAASHIVVQKRTAPLRTGFTDYPYGPPYGRPPNRIQNKNKDITSPDQ